MRRSYACYRHFLRHLEAGRWLRAPYDRSMKTIYIFAAILAGMHEGMTSRIAAPEPITGNAYDLGAPRLSGSMQEAVSLFRESDFVRRHFGEAFARVYAIMKDMECAEFERRISSLEYETYL